MSTKKQEMIQFPCWTVDFAGRPAVNTSALANVDADEVADLGAKAAAREKAGLEVQRSETRTS